MTRRIAPRDLALIVVIVALWGFSFVLIKWALADVPPFALAALRFLLAALPAALFIAPPQMRWYAVVGYGLAIGVCQYGLLFLGMKLGMPAGLSSLVIQLQVFFTIGLAVWIAGDRLHRWNAIGGVIAVAGLAVLGFYKVASGASTTFIGFLLMIGAAIAWATGNIIAKRAEGADMFSLVVWSSLVAPVPLGLVSYFFEGGMDVWRAIAAASWTTWLCVLGLAWGATLFGFARWNALLHRYPTALLQPFALLIPVAGIASGMLFLGERLAPAQVAGVLLVFVGLALNVYGPPLWRALARS